ncbi:MAG: glycosyltransferase [Bacteroidia bacterium]|nr:glycosyltransferase [Bacteroidia bacterium]
MNGTLAYFVNDISTSFVIKDLRMMSLNYKRIILFSTEPVDELHLLPENVELIDNFMDWKRFNKKKILKSFFPSMLLIYFLECWSVKKYLPFKTTLALISSNIFKSQELIYHLNSKQLKVENVDLFYSFWFYDCIYLAWLKKLNPNMRIISRAHGGDLFEDRDSISERPLLRNFQMRYLDVVFSVSKMGTKYLVNRYPKYAHKFKTVFLGSDDHVVLNPFNPDKLVIVSVASIRHLKRIHAIAEAISHVKSEITWYHFGSENLHTNDPKIPDYVKWKSIIQAMPNVKFHPMGYCDNQSLMEFYQKNSVSLFISLSAAEGIPVSMMETISFGIPILSTDVGGCSELVNEKTGKLIPLNSTSIEIANFLDTFSSSKFNTIEFRLETREYWKTHFDASKNYLYFFSEVKKLCS